jgi:PAS domain S-box-containing protein
VSSANMKTMRLLAWSIGVTALLAAILTAAIVWMVEREHRAQDLVAHSRALHEQISHVLLVVQRMESNQRGYLLTGRDRYLGNYNDDEKALPALIDEAVGLIDGDRQQRERLADLRQVIIDKVRELRSTIDEQQAGRHDTALAILNSDRGLQMMDQIRQLFSEMRNEEDRILSSRLSALQTVSAASEAGAPIPLLLIGAIGLLTREYVRRSLSALTVALRQRGESQNRLRLAMDAAHLGSWQYDPLNRVALWSDRRSKQIYDVADDKTDIEEFTKRVHPDDVERVWAAIEAALNPTDPKPYAIEYRIQRSDGEVRWVEAHGLTYFAELRAVSMVGTVQDITERKKREETERLLMREVNHRARNMLSVVDAIAHQTVADTPEDYVERFSERIRALAAYQDLLVRSEWKGVEIEDLARVQLSDFADLIGSRIAMQGPKPRLNPASAQAIGLALHELATNAGKYGALSADTGNVDIRWGTEDDTFTMSWTECGGPAVFVPPRRGFGTVVMQEMAERSVDGKVDLDYAPSGVTWHLTCPAANALEARAGTV